MRRGLTIATLALAAACLAAPAEAVQSTADLREVCASDDLATRNLCYGYIMGAGQLYIELRRAEVIGEIACADPVPTLEVIRVSVVEWIDTHPEHASETAIDGLMRAAAANWPCE